MTTEPTSAPSLHLPSGINFSCHNTGVCCSAFPKVPVDPASARILDTVDLAKIPGTGCALHSASDALVPVEEGGNEMMLRQRADGSCIFLGKDNLCEVHRLYGARTKPQACQDFPYFYRDTPGGVYVGLSFVCPSVRGNRGRAVSEQEDELAGNLLRADRRETGTPVMLNRHYELSWPLYQEIEKSLLGVLSIEGETIETKLIACSALLSFVDTYATRQLGPPEPMADARIIPDVESAQFLEIMRRKEYADLLRVTRKKAGSRLIQRMFLGMVTGFAVNIFRKRGRMTILAGVLGQYARHATGLGGAALYPLPDRTSYRVLARCQFPTQGSGAELVLRYIQHCVFRKDLIYRCTLTRGLNLLILNCALIRWYAAAIARASGREQADESDWSEAIMHVEKWYGHHSAFYETLTSNTTIEDIVESFMARKNYPFVMMG